MKKNLVPYIDISYFRIIKKTLYYTIQIISIDYWAIKHSIQQSNTIANGYWEIFKEVTLLSVINLMSFRFDCIPWQINPCISIIWQNLFKVV